MMSLIIKLIINYKKFKNKKIKICKKNKFKIKSTNKKITLIKII